MPILKEFHKPADLSAALALLKRESPRTVPLAGGTWLNPRIGKQVPAEAVVDLSRLGLDQIERDRDTLRLGPMATLAAVTEDETCRSLADGILAQTARRDAAVNVRNAATLGGTVVVAPVDSELNLALLALAADLSTQSACSEETTTWSLGQFLADPVSALDAGLVTQVRIHLPQRAAGGLARVVRTPADHSIVAAVAVVAEDNCAVRIALGGVAPRPLLVELDPAMRDASNRTEVADEAVARAIATAEPYADFRGTVDYRRAMGALMAKRALEQAAANDKGVRGGQ
jgi:CO/xanthine dehydrogenase FAD-binding subunit